MTESFARTEDLMLTESRSQIRATKNKFENIPVQVFDHAKDVSTAIANRIADLIRERADQGRSCVLGLATGSTPVGVYDELSGSILRKDSLSVMS